MTYEETKHLKESGARYYIEQPSGTVVSYRYLADAKEDAALYSAKWGYAVKIEEVL